MRIALIGDSQSEALWPRLQKSALADGNTFVLIRTQRGWFERNYLKEGKIQQQLIDAKPDVVVIELGGNNYDKSDRYKEEVKKMIAAASTAEAKLVIYLGPAYATKEPYKSNKIWTRSAQVDMLSNSLNPHNGIKIIWLDSFPFTQTGHSDGVHFNSNTYNSWADYLSNKIKDILSNFNEIGLENYDSWSIESNLMNYDKRKIIAGFLTAVFSAATVALLVRHIRLSYASEE